ncbi:hypothetical protein ACFE04_021701 [Oxalis oulophora]
MAAAAGEGTESMELCHPTIDRNNTTVYLRVAEYLLDKEAGVQFRFLVMDEENENLIDTLIPSPPRATGYSVFAVAGEHLYCVGGRVIVDASYDDDDDDDDDKSVISSYENYNDVYRINLTLKEKKWEECKSLVLPRSSAMLFVDNKKAIIYALGNLAENKERDDDPFAEKFDLASNEWNDLHSKIARSSECKPWPWIVKWCVHIPDSTTLVFFGLDVDIRNRGDSFKLFIYDTTSNECGFFDEKFVTKLDSARKYLDSSDALEHPPAQQGDYLYFPTHRNVFCYSLQNRSWLTQPMAGLDLLNIPHYYVVHLIALANENFAMLWYNPDPDPDPEFKANDLKATTLFWIKFEVVNPSESGLGFPKAVCFDPAHAKKFEHPLSPQVDFGYMECLLGCTSSKDEEDSMSE